MFIILLIKCYYTCEFYYICERILLHLWPLLHLLRVITFVPSRLKALRYRGRPNWDTAYRYWPRFCFETTSTMYFYNDRYEDSSSFNKDVGHNFSYFFGSGVGRRKHASIAYPGSFFLFSSKLLIKAFSWAWWYFWTSFTGLNADKNLSTQSFLPPPERISFVRDFTFLREVEASTRAAPSRHAVGHFRVSRVSLDGLRERKDSSWSNR